jgi:hypothetical protein
MGLYCSRDIAHAVMENVLAVIDAVYNDDVGAFSLSHEHKIELISTILCSLNHNGFTIHPLKCECNVQEIGWFSFWLTLCDLKVWKKMIVAPAHGPSTYLAGPSPIYRLCQLLP